MSPGEPPRPPTRETQDALNALDRLLNKHHVITEDQAYRAIRALMPDQEVEMPLDFAKLRGEEGGDEGDEAAAGEASSGEAVEAANESSET